MATAGLLPRPPRRRGDRDGRHRWPARAPTGHRVVLVVATDGAHGEVPDDLAAGETLAERRREPRRTVSAEALGVHRVEFLPYTDSGMTGWEANGDTGCVLQRRSRRGGRAAGRDPARRTEAADVLTIYDWHGGYGHPDHIQVHRVGRRCGRAPRRTNSRGLRVAEATMNRDEMRRVASRWPRRWVWRSSGPTPTRRRVRSRMARWTTATRWVPPKAELTLGVDVAEFIDAKRAAIAAHRSQVSDSSFFLQMPPEFFRQAFGMEWFIEHDREPGPRIGWFFE